MSSLPILGHEPCKEVIIDDKTLFSGELACSDFVVIISKFWLCVNAFFFPGGGGGEEGDSIRQVSRQKRYPKEDVK